MCRDFHMPGKRRGKLKGRRKGMDLGTPGRRLWKASGVGPRGGRGWGLHPFCEVRRRPVMPPARLSAASHRTGCGLRRSLRPAPPCARAPGVLPASPWRDCWRRGAGRWECSAVRFMDSGPLACAWTLCALATRSLGRVLLFWTCGVRIAGGCRPLCPPALGGFLKESP